MLIDYNQPTKESLKSVHKLIKKVTQDIEVFSYNTSISAFMICVNELAQQKCKNRDVLRILVTLIAPFAPHIAEELWEALGEPGSVCDAKWPTWNEEYLVENSVKLGVAFNGKTRFDMEFPADADNDTIQKAVLLITMTIQHKMIWNEAKDYFFIAFGLFLYTIAFTVFLMPYQIVAGGVTGLSAIIYYATGFHLENTYIIINGILLIVALVCSRHYSQAGEWIAFQADGRGTGLHVDDYWLCTDGCCLGYCLPE